jgi:hypothetical protein
MKTDAQSTVNEMGKREHPELAATKLAASKAKVYHQHPDLRELYATAVYRLSPSLQCPFQR